MTTPALYDHELKAFERDVKRITSLIRETLANHNIGGFSFTIRARGRTSAGNARLSFELSESEYGGSGVEASTIRPLVEEFLRRKGFDILNAPLELPAPGTVDEDAF